MDETEYSKWWLDFYLHEALNKGIKYVGIVDHFKEKKAYFSKYIDLDLEEVDQKQAIWLD